VTLDEQLRARGFANEAEYYAMIARLPASADVERFKEWRDRKGTKAELEAIAKAAKER
jgi:hypothetical protein